MRIPTELIDSWPPCTVCGQPAQVDDVAAPEIALCADCDADISAAAASYYPAGAIVPGWRVAVEWQRRLPAQSGGR